MDRKLKGLGLALLAAFAMSAVVASAASAEGVYKADAHHVFIRGEQPAGKPHLFTTDIGSVTCTTAKFEGTHLNNNTPTPTSTTTLTITPTYTGCQLHGLGINVTVNMNGCHYRFETPTVIPGTANHTTWHSNVTVVCPGTNVISVSGTGCTITVPGQTLGKVDYHLQGSGSTRDVLVNSTVTGITYNSHGFLCNNTTHRSNGTYSGEVTTKAFNAVTGNQVGAWIETHK